MAGAFAGVREAAANLGGDRGDYSVELFREDFPQFFTDSWECHLPDTVLQGFIAQANQAVSPLRWQSAWRYGAGLFVAHHATLYLRAFAPYTDTPAQAAGTGDLVGVVKSAALGDSSVSYETGSVTGATENWGSLNSTQYGQLLATQARLVGMGGSYVI